MASWRFQGAKHHPNQNKTGSFQAFSRRSRYFAGGAAGGGEAGAADVAAAGGVAGAGAGVAGADAAVCGWALGLIQQA
jgi:hypothetical protein